MVSLIKGVIMKITKFMAVTIAVLITVLLSSAAQAQTGAFVSFKGIEISAGHQEPSEAYGWICYAKTTGDLPGNLTVSMDYERTNARGATNSVTGGAWTLPVYGPSIFPGLKPIRIDGYRGLFFGSVEAGVVTWDKRGTFATVELKMLIKGGTQEMANINGTAVLLGTITYDEKGAGTFSGSVYFEFK
jgi:hypothetical protein